MLKSWEHRETCKHLSSSSEVYKDLSRHAAASIKEQQQLESIDTLSFDQFLEEYLALKLYD